MCSPRRAKRIAWHLVVIDDKYWLLGYISSGEDAGDVVKYVGRALFVVTVVADESLFDHVDFLLRFLVDDAGDEAGELDRVFLVFKQLQLQRFVQTFVRLEIELLAVDR